QYTLRVPSEDRGRGRERNDRILRDVPFPKKITRSPGDDLEALLRLLELARTLANLVLQLVSGLGEHLLRAFALRNLLDGADQARETSVALEHRGALNVEPLSGPEPHFEAPGSPAPRGRSPLSGDALAILGVNVSLPA